MNPESRVERALQERQPKGRLPGFVSMADVAELHEEHGDLRDGDRWGRWTYRATERVLEIDAYGPGRVYRVDLDRCPGASQRLEWIFHIAGKGWATAADVGHLVRALRSMALAREAAR